MSAAGSWVQDRSAHEPVRRRSGVHAHRPCPPCWLLLAALAIGAGTADNAAGQAAAMPGAGIPRYALASSAEAILDEALELDRAQQEQAVDLYFLAAAQAA